MRQINRRTGKLSGNYKRHLKKIGKWDHWDRQRKITAMKEKEELEPIPGTQGTAFRPKEEL